MWRKLARASIWHPLAVPVEEWKYRNLMRLWLPVYDVVAFTAGIVAVIAGSRILNQLLHPDWVDILGAAMSLSAVVCLLGVSFPRLWVVEMVGKVLLVSLVSAYIAATLMLSSDPFPNLFPVLMLAWGLPLALFRVQLIGEEYKNRRATEGGADD